MKFYHDRQVHKASYEIGDRVWLLNSVNKVGLSKKLRSRWKGPYVVQTVLNSLNYKIKLDGSRGRSSVVHVNRLKQCFSRLPELALVNTSTSSDLDSQNPGQNLDAIGNSLIEPDPDELELTVSRGEGELNESLEWDNENEDEQQIYGGSDSAAHNANRVSEISAERHRSDLNESRNGSYFVPNYYYNRLPLPQPSTRPTRNRRQPDRLNYN